MSIRAPDGHSLEELRLEFPGALESLDEHDDSGDLGLLYDRDDDEPRLTFEHDVPSDTHVWDPDLQEWVELE